MRNLVLPVLCAVALTPAWADNSIDERADADKQGKVEIENVSGSVEVTGWNKPEVRVTGELGSGVDELLFEAEGDHTLIKVVHDRGHHHGGSAELEIWVPEMSRLSVTTVSAEIAVSDVKGAQRLQAVSADVETHLFAEDAEVRTVSGDLEIDGENEDMLLTVTTVSGDAEVRSVSGELVAQTVSGDLEVDGGSLSRLRLRTTSGDMEIEATMAGEARFDMETINGDLTLNLGGDISAEFDIETFNGDIENCFGPEAVRTSKYAPGWELRFKEGTGDGRVRIKTLNGGVYLCTR